VRFPFSLTPGPPPFSAMNSTPAASKAPLNASRVTPRGRHAPLSKRFTVETDSSFRREFLHVPAERRACHPALDAGHFAPLSYPCPKARRNASDAGGNAGDLASAALPSACDRMRRMASDRDGRGSGCAAIQASIRLLRSSDRRTDRIFVISGSSLGEGRLRYFYLFNPLTQAHSRPVVATMSDATQVRQAEGGVDAEERDD
jgi:hypothetical protein